MRRLLLLRHAKSSWDDPALSDHARPLNSRGRKAAAAVAQLFHRPNLAPDLVLVSSARRTLQTLEALSPLPGQPRIEATDSLYLATPDTMLEAIRLVPEETHCVLMIGHNPGMHELAMKLLGRPALEDPQGDAHRLGEGYPTAALAEFTVEGAWDRLSAGGGRLVRFVTPADLAD
ncbi:histidine phosphatase superfamily [Roseomonas sp. TAS13]|uniref:SixA phosphatase family protein n=1 Tax=Roseomonas sp. TAS13 TaxID=1926319 RepID=UPI00095D0BC6|nr:histidine phosphatase family protein [Roseomonas sp. TAS13]GAV33157.1 histidine phosphatase superfamily [Roseomonas sp. TAS13]